MSRQIESKTIFSAVDRVSPITAKIAKGMSPLSNQLSKISTSFKDFGSSTLLKSGAGLTGMFLGAVKPAMAFEKSIAQVFKTFDPARVGITEKSFSKTVRNMSADMGIMATQMAEIFENMPLPEILNIENISSADKYKGIMDMANMTAMSLTTMGLEASDAGDKMKSMFNVLGGKDINKVIQTMNAVNEMGNQFGVKPADTLEFLTRQGALGLGNTAKLTNLETTAIGGTMLGFGATPETAKTSFQKMINVGQAYTSATDKQVKAFQKLGTSAKQFAEYWQKSPTDAIIEILNKAKGLNEIEVTPVFKELFGVEGSVNIKTMMLNLDGFVKKLKLVNDEQAINNSVFNEFKKLSKTSSFAVDKLKSSLNNVGIVLGNALLPTITKIADKISEWTKKYEKLNPETKKLIGDTVLFTAGMLAFGVAVGGVSYALGGLALAMGAVSKAGKIMGGADLLGGMGGRALSKSKDNWQKLGDRKNNTGWTFKGRSKFNKANITEKIFGKGVRDISSASLAVSKMVGVVGIAITAFEVLTATVMAVAVPFAPLIAVVSGISIAIYAMYKRWDEFKQKFSEIGISLGILAEQFGLSGAGGSIISSCELIANSIGGVIGDSLLLVLDLLDKFILNLAKGIAGVGTLVSTLSFSKAQKAVQGIDDEYEIRKMGDVKSRISSANARDFLERSGMGYLNQKNNIKVDVSINDNTTQTKISHNSKDIKDLIGTRNVGNNSPIKNNNNYNNYMFGG